MSFSSLTNTSADAILDLATSNVKRYVSRAGEMVFQPDWKSDLPKNGIALGLGYFAVETITRLADPAIEHILLNYFPEISRDWCFAYNGEKGSRLVRVQEGLKKVLLLVVVLMRWPGWSLGGWRLHLWECVLYGVVGFAVLEAVVVVGLVVVNGFLLVGHWMAQVTGWEPNNTNRGKIEGDGRVHFAIGEGKTTPIKEKRFTAPGSIGMGKFLKSYRGDAESKGEGAVKRRSFWTKVSKHGLFFAKELEGAKEVTAVYDSVMAKEQNWDVSEEELRLQHYKDTGRLAMPTTPPTSESLSTVTQSKFDEEVEEQKQEMKETGGKLLPSWLSARSFRDSIFGSSAGTEASRDSFGKSTDEERRDSVVNSLTPRSATPDLLTGSPLRRRFA